MGASRRILIVDDNPNMSALLADMLEVFEYESVRANDGADALKRIEAEPFAMVITDMRMPNMTGLELLDQIKARHPKLPVVIISGYAVGEVQAHATKADGVLGKPLLMADIERLLNSLL
jgi:two-component system response regulator FlrC